MKFSSKVRTCLLFNNQCEEAAEFYTSLLPGSNVENVLRPDPNGSALVVEFTLSDVPYMALNAGPEFRHSPGASISVITEDQQETDFLWNKLVADGGKEGMCAWLQDKYGVSWQIVPEPLLNMIWADDRVAAARAMDAMMKMKKIDIAAIEAAFNAN